MADRRALVTLAAAAIALLALVAPTHAQILDDPTTSSTTSTTTTSAPPSSDPSESTTTAPPPSSTTTTEPADEGPGLLGGDSTTTTTTTSTPPEQEGGGDPIAPADDSTPAPDGAGTGEDGEGGAEDPGTPRTVPPEAQAIIDAVVRSPSNNSRALYDAVQELVALGLSPSEAVRVGFGRFPVGGIASYSHDWLFPRYGPGFRFHLGTDVFAPFGTPLRAPVDGTVTSGVGNLGGLYVKVFMEDGTYFYMAHLSALPEGFVDGMTVRTGDIVGYVGDSGNAKGGSPHLHLGVYPQGGSAVDPKPILDQMLADALEALPAIVEHFRANPPAPDAARGPARRSQALLATDLLRGLVDERAAGGASTALLYETAGNPAAGGIAVVEAQAEAVAASIDWNERAALARAQDGFAARAEALFGAALGPSPARDAGAFEAALTAR